MRLEKAVTQVNREIGPSHPLFWPLSIGLVVVLLAVSGGVFYFVERTFAGSQPYQDSLARLRANPDALARLGTPIEPGRFVTGTSDSGGREEAIELSIPVSGPKGHGSLEVSGHKRAGAWTYATMTLSVEGDRLDLLPTGR